MHAIPAPRSLRIDPSRIAGISGAIVVNGLLFALLVAPMATPIMRTLDDDPDIVLIPPKVQTPPDPPRPPEQVEIRDSAPTPPTHVPQTQTRAQPADQPATSTAEINDYAVPEAATQPDDGGTGTVVEPAIPTGPLTGAHLEYDANPAPSYPVDALRDQLSGTVLLEVLVDVDGRPIDVKISRSSGVRSLDAAAKRQVLSKWRFKPAMRNGVTVQAIGLVPVDFKLD